MVDKELVQKVKDHFLKLSETSDIPERYKEHVETVERLVKKIAETYTEANQEILLLSAWLHDIGTFLGDRDIHEINSEKETNRYLKELGVDEDVVAKVAHCVRSHRCNESKPESLEAKILAVADSASHLIDGPYINMTRKFGKKIIIEKLERDYRDIGLLPEIKDELEPLYIAWKNLLNAYPEGF